MPANKDLKRLVRARMRRTGEAYTTARARLLAKPRPSQDHAPAAPPAHPDFAAMAGMSDATLAARTGCTWERWVHALDRVGAHAWPHREIAAYVRDKYQVSGWWSQWVTTGYERIKGIRAPGQRLDGAFEANKSKVISVPLARLYRAVRDGRTRRRWLGDVKLKVRTETPEKSIRVTWPDGTLIQFYFESRSPGRSQLVVQQTGLADREALERAKAFWAERLASLSKLLVPSHDPNVRRRS